MPIVNLKIKSQKEAVSIYLQFKRITIQEAVIQAETQTEF